MIEDYRQANINKPKLWLALVALLADVNTLGNWWLYQQTKPSTASFETETILYGQATALQISGGGASLFLGGQPLKEAGIVVYRAGEFAEAEQLFLESFKEEQKDPETLIYLNNSVVSQQESFVAIATIRFSL
ncbi:MAG: hypothetical protein WBB82_13745 [Limnothrix sp.]